MCVLEDTEETKQSYNEMQSSLDKMTTNDIKHQRKDTMMTKRCTADKLTQHLTHSMFWEN